MKVDNSSIHKPSLLEFINKSYNIGEGLKIDFIPKGEEGYCYSLETKSREKYFVKVIKTERNLTKALTAIHNFHLVKNKTYLLSPIQSKSGDVVVCFGLYQISVFPYINGISIYEGQLTLDDTIQIATMMADFHLIDKSEIFSLPSEQFDNPFEKNILKILSNLKEKDNSVSTYRQQARKLFENEKADILSTLHRMTIMQEKLTSLSLIYSFTHGDPNYANIMRESEGQLYLIDFGEVAYGPIERDIVAFIGNEFFQPFLLEYVKHNQNAKFHIDVFEFYLYRWALQEISDYGSQLFFGSMGEEENEHAWAELQPYLPLPHEEIAKSLNNIKKELDKC
ncbi:phosphotransferase [Lederbergia wuyishanensis]|uniref:Ser/Thr protein kinase RdoA (MazF antagonist) n=1 Tax=Lederbergia wuyishanensis TaxID=1347903 RepID=A0ABU0D0K4_9BACI|nr:phosphotransferase [Lederbergia wuyishanensis]MCJ8006543.1 phosphotransferase [Lederbergia wuyishanensis]MDQ0341922.1 Ser/Thr protein kinase RdoA (MazF antagonist) [Lederbergia wuyishanensis]